MQIFNSRSYWFMQIAWWTFATGYLRFPYSKYFQDKAHLYPYLTFSFLVCFIFSHLYAWVFPKFSHIKHISWYFAISGSIILSTILFGEDAFYNFMRYTKPNLGLPLITEDYIRFYSEPFKIVTLWFLFYHLLYINLKNQIELLALADAKTALKTAELEVLVNQLNPHFLFNSLNSIKALTNDEPQRAKMAITMLSDLLRASLTFGNNQTVKLEDEIKLVKQYLTLEKIRFEKRLSFNIDIADNVKENQIPPMTIQLLVENAIKHGIGKRKDGGKIWIEAFCVDNLCLYKVKNSGILYNDSKDLGVGLQNLQKRLKICFGENAHFGIFQEGEFVVAEIKIQKPI